MKIAFVTPYDARNVLHWSGLGFFIARALEREGCQLEYFGPLTLDPTTWLLTRLKSLWFNHARRSRYLRTHDALVARRFARVVDRALAGRDDIDLVFSPGTIPVAFMRDTRPLAIWSDATHHGLFNFYDEYTGLCRQNIRDGDRIESTALSRASAALFASDWAAESATSNYHAAVERIHVVPFGANLDDPPGDAEVESHIAARPRDRCRLLFIGMDWRRKGGPLAVDVADRLNRTGFPTELTVVGCQPYLHTPSPPFVRVEGFLSKRNPTDNARLRQLLASHHFLIVPSAAECYGLVYCEANAFGTPCLARRVGGVPTIIRDGENGLLFNLQTSGAEYARAVMTVFGDYDRYRTMAHNARRQFVERLNWNVAGRRAAAVLRAAGARPPTPA